MPQLCVGEHLADTLVIRRIGERSFAQIALALRGLLLENVPLVCLVALPVAVKRFAAARRVLIFGIVVSSFIFLLRGL